MSEKTIVEDLIAEVESLRIEVQRLKGEDLYGCLREQITALLRVARAAGELGLEEGMSCGCDGCKAEVALIEALKEVDHLLPQIQ